MEGEDSSSVVSGLGSLVGDDFGDGFGDRVMEEALVVVETVDVGFVAVLEGAVVVSSSGIGARCEPPKKLTTERTPTMIQCLCSGVAPFFSLSSCSKNHAPGNSMPNPMSIELISRSKNPVIRNNPPRTTPNHERITFQIFGFLYGAGSGSGVRSKYGGRESGEGVLIVSFRKLGPITALLVMKRSI